MPISKVLDSWAVLAWLRKEEAAPRVRAMIQAADRKQVQLSMSWINAGEVYYMLVRKVSLKAAEDFFRRLSSLPIRVVLPDEDIVKSAARLKSTRRISYADGFAVALARIESATLVTGDPELRAMSDLISIEWIGENVN